MRRGLVTGGIVGLSLLCVCELGAAKPAAAPAHDALARARRMLERLDRLEADLHEEAAQLRLYAELEDRHQNISQIACRVADEHIKEMRRLALAQEEKRRERGRGRRSLAVVHARRRISAAN